MDELEKIDDVILIACPVCGGDPWVSEEDDDIVISCERCGREVRSGFGIRDAAEMWNMPT